MIVANRDPQVILARFGIDVHVGENSMLLHLLEGISVKGLIDLHALVAKHFAVGGKNGGIKNQIQLLVPAGDIFGSHAVGIHKNIDPELAFIARLHLSQEGDQGVGGLIGERFCNCLFWFLVLELRGIDGEVPAAITQLNSVALGFDFNRAIFTVPLFVVGVITERVRSRIVGQGQCDALLNFILVDVGLAASLACHLAHGLLSRSDVGDSCLSTLRHGVKVARFRIEHGFFHSADQATRVHGIDRNLRAGELCSSQTNLSRVPLTGNTRH